MELVGAKPLHLLTQTVPSLESPTGAFIASQTLIFRRKQIIRTHLLSETSSDYFCLVRVARIELTASGTPFKRATKTALHPDIDRRFPTEAWRQEILYSGKAVLSTDFLIIFGFFREKSDFYTDTRFFVFAVFQCFSASAARCARSRSNSGRRYWPVKLPGTAATCSGVPSATISPPALPPSGPRSMI